MRILLTLGDPYLPQRSGGAQSSTDQSAKALIASGHTVAIACKLESGRWTKRGSRILNKIFSATFSHDTLDGYSVYRARDPTDLTEVVRKFRPDVAIVQNGSTVPMGKSLQSLGIPVLIYFRNVEFDEARGNFADLTDPIFVANSEFTARKVQEVLGLSCSVIRPFINPALYRTATTRQNVTFVNPYAVKGADIAFDIAEQCPDIPFVFVESWGIYPDLRASIDERMKKLPNVSLHLRTTDMRTIYSRARILLVPSRWEEAWGRVASEAHFSGIPVVGSKQGGLPEAIGPGGVTIDINADISHWVAAVRRLWDDDSEYARISTAALKYSQRLEMQEGFQTAQLIEVLTSATACGRSTRDVSRATS